MSHADLSLPSIPSSPLRPTQLVLVRHGEVEAAYQRVFGGRIDMNLSPAGHEQAKALAHWLKQQPFDAVYASPMKRVGQTLAPWVTQGATPIIVDDFREIDFGDWTGLTWEEVSERYRIHAFQWLDQLERGAIPNAEKADAYRARIEKPLRKILADHAGRNIAIACHGGVIRAMLAILLELPLAKMAGFEIDYASVTAVALLPHKTEVQFLNFTPWDEPAL